MTTPNARKAPLTTSAPLSNVTDSDDGTLPRSR